MKDEARQESLCSYLFIFVSHARDSIKLKPKYLIHICKLILFHVELYRLMEKSKKYMISLQKKKKTGVILKSLKPNLNLNLNLQESNYCHIINT